MSNCNSRSTTSLLVVVVVVVVVVVIVLCASDSFATYGTIQMCFD